MVIVGRHLFKKRRDLLYGQPVSGSADAVHYNPINNYL